MNEKSLQVPGAAIGAVHGYRRNQGSLLWTAAWAWFGHSLPIIATGIAIVQGFGKPKGS